MRLSLAILAVAALVGVAMLLTEGLTSSEHAPTRTVVQAPPAKAPLRTDSGVTTTEPAKPIWRGPRHLTALVSRRTELRDRPHGRP
ncbi:MAG: hypothetical protein ACJ76V_16030, partial [Thermoleophilaceae bacterium]